MLDTSFNFSFYPSDGQFRISSKPTKSVKFQIVYTHVRDGKEVQEQLSGGGKADARTIYETKVLAGTQSDSAQVKHAVKKGEVTAEVMDINGKVTNYRKVFTISEKGVVEVRDATGEVQGVATESSMLNNPESDFIARDVSQQLVSPRPIQATPSPLATTGEKPVFGAALQNIPTWVWFVSVCGAVIVSMGIVSWWMRRRTTL